MGEEEGRDFQENIRMTEFFSDIYGNKSIRCYLDGKLDGTVSLPADLFGSTTR